MQNLKLKYVLVLLSVILLSVFVQAAPSQKITSLGAFSNFRFTEEHQYGAGVQLWQEGTSVFGLFHYSQGLIGDTPTGTLDKVTFNSKTGHLVFTAKLTLGQHFCNIHKNGVHSQNIFYFDGVLTNKSLSGKLKIADNLHQDRTPIEKNIALNKTKNWFVTQSQNREQWEKAIKDILKFRGPKW